MSEATRYRILRTPPGRYVIVNADAPKFAWSGSRWVAHQNGIGILVQVSNWETREEADAAARSYGFIPFSR